MKSLDEIQLSTQSYFISSLKPVRNTHPLRLAQTRTQSRIVANIFAFWLGSMTTRNIILATLAL